jgi:copper(I)-binding protein
VEIAPGHRANTAAYMRIEGDARTADQLLDVRAEFAMAELHRTTIDASGLATMAPAGPVTVQRGESVRMEPGGLHIMLMGVTRSLSAGEVVELTLVFETAGEVTVRAEVREF